MVRGVWGVLVLVLFCHGLNTAQGGEIRELYRSPKYSAMGGASVSQVTGHEAIFLNPAGLGGNGESAFHGPDTYTEISGDVLEMLLINPSALTSLNISTFTSLMGKNIYAKETIAVSLLMPYFGLTAFFDQQASVRIRNQVFPNVHFGFQSTSGVQMAVGYGFGSRGRSAERARRRGRPMGEFRIGFAGKFLFRRGGYQDLPTTTLLRATEGLGLVREIVGDAQIGYGGDLGLQYDYTFSKEVAASIGAVWADIGTTNFGAADPQPQNISVGISGTFTFDFGQLTVAYDYRNITRSLTEWRQRNHIGLEWKMPVITILAGMNQVYWTAGAMFDLWLFKITALSYAQETGTYVFQQPNRRYTVSTELKFAL